MKPGRHERRAITPAQKRFHNAKFGGIVAAPLVGTSEERVAKAEQEKAYNAALISVAKELEMDYLDFSDRFFKIDAHLVDIAYGVPENEDGLHRVNNLAEQLQQSCRDLFSREEFVEFILRQGIDKADVVIKGLDAVDQVVRVIKGVIAERKVTSDDYKWYCEVCNKIDQQLIDAGRPKEATTKPAFKAASFMIQTLEVDKS